MVPTIFLAGLIASSTPAASGHFAMKSPETVLQSCGLAKSDYGVAWDDELEEDVVQVKQLSGPNARKQIDCIGRASLGSSATYVFSSAEAQRRFYQAQERSPLANAAREGMRKEAIQSLAREHLLASARSIKREGGPLAARARKIEALAGLSSGSALQVRGNTIYVRPRPGSSISFGRLKRLMDLLEVAVPDEPVAVVVEEAPSNKSSGR